MQIQWVIHHINRIFNPFFCLEKRPHLRRKLLGPQKDIIRLQVDGLEVVPDQIVFHDEPIKEITIDYMIPELFFVILEFLERCPELPYIIPKLDILEERLLSGVVVVAPPGDSDESGGSVSDLLLQIEFLHHEVALLLFVIILHIVIESDHHERDHDDSPDAEHKGHDPAGESLGVVVPVSDRGHGDDDPPEAVDVRVEAVGLDDEADGAV